MSKPEPIEYGLAANAIDFVLMAACRAAEIAPKLYIIQGPASKLRPTEEVKIARYRVDGANRKKVAGEEHG